MTKHEDHRFIDALRQGNDLLINELYKELSPKVIRWVLNNNGSISDAKDIFQEAILAVYNMACDPGFILKYPIGGLIFRICKNKWIDQIRKKTKESEVRILEKERYDNVETTTALLEQIETEEIRQSKLDKAFQMLTELCQNLLKLTMEGISPKEIAVQLQMSDANSVYRRKNACIERWKTLFKNNK